MAKGKESEESSVGGSVASTKLATNKKTRALMADTSVAVASVASARDIDGAALEGWLYKQGSRTKLWHNRFFVLRGNKISYYDTPEDEKAKVSLEISNERQCEVGSLFIDERQKGSKKELLYCIKITWSSLVKGAKEGDDASDEVGSITPGTGTQTPVWATDSVSPLGDEDVLSIEDAPKLKNDAAAPRSILRLRKSKKKDDAKPPRVTLSRSRTEENTQNRNSPVRASLGRSRTDGDRLTRSEGRGSIQHQRTVSHAPESEGRGSIQHRRTISHAPESFVSTGAIDRIESPPKNLGHRRTRSDGSFLSLTDALATPDLNGKDDSVVRPHLNKEKTPGEKVLNAVERNQLALTSQKQRQTEEQQLMQSLYFQTKKASRKKTKKKIANASKMTAAVGAAVTVGVLTAGVGLLAGLVFIGAGAAASGTGVVAGAGYKFSKKKRGEIIIGTSNYELARQWKDALDACLATESLKRSTWGQMFALEGRSTVSAVLATADNSNRATLSRDASEEWTGKTDKAKIRLDPESRWRPMEGGWATMLGTGAHGARIFREDRLAQGARSKLSVAGQPNPPLKGQLVLHATPLDAFMCLMSLPRISIYGDPLVPNSGQRASFRVVESIDEHMDVIHWVFHPLFLFPTWTAPRDFVVSRYWRLEPDGTYVVCCDSVEHSQCPPLPSYTRGEMNGVYTISPKKKRYHGRSQVDSSGIAPECLLTAVIQVDPKGWVPNKPVPILANQGYGEAFAVSALLQLLNIRDAVDHDRFVPVASDIHTPKPFPNPNDFGLSSRQGIPNQDQLLLTRSASMETEDDPVNYDFAYSMREMRSTSSLQNPFASVPPQLETEFWAEPDANSFRVRGKMYKKDKKKINAGRSIGRLIATDVVVVDKTQYGGMCNHPTQRYQLALERERQGLESGLPPFLFVVNICLPGPPFFHGVFYYAIDDISTIDGSDGTPSSKLCNEFIFGDSDKFRNETFKLIPQIVEGNFIVRKAVGSTPAIMGTKLTQTYARGDRFFEVILDCGSSSVATGVIRVSLGYCTEMVIDMGFLLEGKDESVLPERIFGGARINKLHFDPARLRFMKEPEDCT